MKWFVMVTALGGLGASGCVGEDAAGGGEDGPGTEEGPGEEQSNECVLVDAPQSGMLCFPKENGYRCCPDEEGPLPEGGATDCYCPIEEPVGDGPAAEAWYALESSPEGDQVHVRIAFAEWFVDNTYGVNSSADWGDRGHKFRELLGSDHVQLGFLDAAGAVQLSAKFDYITESDASATGYENLGVAGGDGGVLEGSEEAVIATMTSLDRNFNERGCVFPESSPTAPECPTWDPQVVYEAWVRADLFGPAGFGSIQFESVHASPSKAESNTIEVEPCTCPAAGDVQ